MYPFVTTDEARERWKPPTTSGVRVVRPPNKWLFPGGTITLAMTLAKDVLSDDILTDPTTVIEIGSVINGVFVAEKIIKSAVNNAANQ